MALSSRFSHLVPRCEIDSPTWPKSLSPSGLLSTFVGSRYLKVLPQVWARSKVKPQKPVSSERVEQTSNLPRKRASSLSNREDSITTRSGRKVLKDLDPNAGPRRQALIVAQKDDDDIQNSVDEDDYALPTSLDEKEQAANTSSSESEYELRSKRAKRNVKSVKSYKVFPSKDKTPSTSTNIDSTKLLNRDVILQEILDLPDVQTQGISEKLVAFFESVPLPTSSSSDAPHPSSELVLERVLVDELGSATDDAQIDNIVDKITPTWWPSTDPATDEVWDEFVRNEIKLVASGEVSALVKPSGTLAAPLMILWHYPSMATTHQAFGVTADDSNPCLRMQFKKFREQSVSNMLTIDSVLRRFDLGLHRRVKVPGEPYDNETEEWKTLNKSLIKWLLDHSAAKVVLLLGKRNVESVTDIFPTAISI